MKEFEHETAYDCDLHVVDWPGGDCGGTIADQRSGWKIAAGQDGGRTAQSQRGDLASRTAASHTRRIAWRCPDEP